MKHKLLLTVILLTVIFQNLVLSQSSAIVDRYTNELATLQREFRLWEEGLEPEFESIVSNFTPDTIKVNSWLKKHEDFDKRQEQLLNNLIHDLKLSKVKLTPEFYAHWNNWMNARKQWLKYDRESLQSLKQFVLEVIKHDNDFSRKSELEFKTESTRLHFESFLNKMSSDVSISGDKSQENKWEAMSAFMDAMEQIGKDNP